MLQGAWMQPHKPAPLPRKVEVDLSEILIQPRMLAPAPAESPRRRNILVDLHTRKIEKWAGALYIFTSALGVFLIGNFWLDYTDSGVRFYRWLGEWIQGQPPKVVAHSNAIVPSPETTRLRPEQPVTQSLSSLGDLPLPDFNPTLALAVVGPVPPPTSSFTQLDKLPPQTKPAAPAVARRSTIIKKTNKHVSHSKSVSLTQRFLRFLQWDKHRVAARK
jgi:hypothetical protein